MFINLRYCLLIMPLLIWYVDAVSVNNYETVHTSNAAILNRLGLSPLDIPDGHHKKRLAGPEPPAVSSSIYSRIHQPYSRRHGHRDSHVYVVKLPASPPYYTVTKPHKSMNKDDKITTKNGVDVVGSSMIHQSPSVGFHSNGKPAKIYHWNLPLMKKINEKKRYHVQLRMDQMKKQMETERMVNKKQQEQEQQQQQQQSLLSLSQIIPKNKLKMNESNIKLLNLNNVNHDEKIINSKHTRNNDKRLNYPETMEVFRRINSITDYNGAAMKHHQVNGTRKMYRLDSSLYRLEQHPNDRLATWSLPNDLDSNIRNANVPKVKKHRKKAAMSYYAPIINKTGSTSIHKNFPGNGKPMAFYVMEKSRKPVYYHPLLP